MKYFLLVFLLITSNIYSQENSDKVYNSSEVDEKPEFVGGMEKFYKFTAKNFNVPSGEGIKGKIIVEFIIEKDGSITNINVIQDIGYGTAEETISFLKKSPRWKPGKKNGEIVRTLYRLPITLAEK
ncbi:energy transducer TonB [Flavobacterium koreense]